MQTLSQKIRAIVARNEVNAEGWTEAIDGKKAFRYVVATTNNGAKPAFRLLASQVQETKKAFPLFNTTVGGWTDSATGKRYVDVGIGTNTKENALAIAREYSQIAIWDLQESKEIRV